MGQETLIGGIVAIAIGLLFILHPTAFAKFWNPYSKLKHISADKLNAKEREKLEKGFRTYVRWFVSLLFIGLGLFLIYN